METENIGAGIVWLIMAVVEILFKISIVFIVICFIINLYSVVDIGANIPKFPW